VAAERAGTQPDTSFRSWILSGRAMAAAHDAPLAMQFFGKALRDKPEDAQALTGLGVAALLGGDQTRATVYFQRALKAMPSYEPARTLLGKLDPASVRRR
jgi:cytochrome c-type biogenesis protein CcmH/NrfG